MTTSPTQSFLSEIVAGHPVPTGKLAYFRARLAGRVHQALLGLFAKLEREHRLTRGELAKRIHRKPEQITRWLSHPNNLTIDTTSDLFIGLGYEIDQVVLVNVSTGEKLALPEVRAQKNISNLTAAQPAPGLKGSRARGGNVIDLMEALRASLEKSQEAKERKQGPRRSSSSALSQIDTTGHPTGAAGLAAQNQLQQRPIAHSLEETA